MNINKYVEDLIKYGINYDASKRVIKKGRNEVTLYFLSSLIDELTIDTLLIFLNELKSFKNLETKLPLSSVIEVEELDELIEHLSNGLVLICTKENNYLIDVRSYPTRAVSEPQSEKTIRGSRDGFVETLNTNIALIRRRIKSKDLRIDSFSVSNKSKMQVSLIYLEGYASIDIVNEIKTRINSLNIDSLVMSDRALEELIFNQKLSPFPLVRYTERPDVASIALMNNKILIMVDTSSSVIITPTTLIDHTKHVEEFRLSPLVGSFIRGLRSIAIFLSVFLVPIWLLLIQNNDIANVFSIGLTQDLSPTQVIIQIFVAELLFEIIRIASIHTPSHLTSAISLLAAIILGQVSMELGLFLPEILLISSISSICGFATPSYELSMSNKLVKLFLIIISAFLGKIGFILAISILFIYLISIKIWDKPYLYPLCPLDIKKAKKLFYRNSANKKKRL